VHWLRRPWRATPREAGADEPEEPEEKEAKPPLRERSAPGIEALFAGLREDGSHAILDLGPAAGSSFRLYSRFARRIRFADLLNAPSRGEGWAKALQSLSRDPEHLYDLVLVWNLLDRVPPKGRSLVVESLARLTTSGARLYVVVDVSGDPTPRPLRFTLLGLDRVGQQQVGDPYPALPQLLPAKVERLLHPFRVEHGFTLKLGLREYVAVRR